MSGRVSRQCLRAIDRATPQPAVGGGQSSQLGEEGEWYSTLGREGEQVDQL